MLYMAITKKIQVEWKTTYAFVTAKSGHKGIQQHTVIGSVLISLSITNVTIFQY